ncbi:MAG: hypothetical protein ACYDDS_19645 [Candidatus Sulfotelmatobacter sp.]
METPAKAIGLNLALCAPWLAVIIFSWIQWARAKQPRTLSSTFSLAGLVLATASVLFAFVPSLYAGSFDVARQLGAGASLVAVFVTVCGAWRPHPLRWRALACGAGMVAFWFLSLVLE